MNKFFRPPEPIRSRRPSAVKVRSPPAKARLTSAIMTDSAIALTDSHVLAGSPVQIDPRAGPSDIYQLLNAGGPLPQPSPWAIQGPFIQYPGGVVVGNPLGQGMGAGSVNAQSYYVNGALLAGTGAGSYTLIRTLTPSGSALGATGLPPFTEYFIAFNGVALSVVAQLQFFVSSNNGSIYNLVGPIGTHSGTTQYGILILTNPGGVLCEYRGLSSGSSTMTADAPCNVYAGFFAPPGGPINALAFQPVSGTFSGTNSISIYGR